MFPLKEKELVMYHTRIKKMYWAQQSLNEREREPNQLKILINNGNHTNDYI